MRDYPTAKEKERKKKKRKERKEERKKRAFLICQINQQL